MTNLPTRSSLEGYRVNYAPVRLHAASWSTAARNALKVSVSAAPMTPVHRPPSLAKRPCLTVDRYGEDAS